MKYTINNKNILILAERTVFSSMGRMLEGKLANQVTADRFDVLAEYEIYEGTESIVNLKVNDRLIIDNMCLNVMSLIRVNEDVLPYILNLFSLSYTGSLSDLYEELEDYYYIAIEKGIKRKPNDRKALKVMREFLCCDTSKSNESESKLYIC